MDTKKPRKLDKKELYKALAMVVLGLILLVPALYVLNSPGALEKLVQDYPFIGSDGFLLIVTAVVAVAMFFSFGGSKRKE